MILTDDSTNHLGKCLLFFELDLSSDRFDVTGSRISLQFKQNTFNSSLARSGDEIYFPQDAASPPRPELSEVTFSDIGLIPKALSSLKPQLEQVFPPRISYNFSLIVS